MAIDIEQLRADIAAGSPGPWDAIEDGHEWDNYVVGPSCGYDGDFKLPADARRIARLPDLEAEYLRLREAADALAELVAELLESDSEHETEWDAAAKRSLSAYCAAVKGGRQMTVLAPIPDEFPNPDCEKCGGEGVPQSFAHRILADDYSNKACPECWQDEDMENAK